MKVLIIGTTDILGGAAKISWDIKAALEASGHQASMFVADKRSDDPKVRVIPRQKWRKALGFLLSTESLLDSDWIMDTPEFKEADIVHCHNIHGRYFNLATLQKMSVAKPVVWTLHDEWAITAHCAYTMEGTEMANGLYACPDISVPPRLLWDNSRKLARWKIGLYRVSKLTVVTPCHWLQDRVKKTPLGEQSQKLIPNGIDTARFVRADKAAARAKLGLPADKRIVLFLANDAKNNTWKGWKYTAEVIAKTKDQDVLFLSVGNLVSHPDEPNVRYVGQIKEKSDLALYYSAADALLFTSIAENFPLVILEAMSCGLPIVSFDVGGVKEAVAHLENGFIGRYKSVEDLEKGFAWLWSLSPEEREQISAKSSAKVKERYTMEAMTDAYISLYKDLYGRRS